MGEEHDYTVYPKSLWGLACQAESGEYVLPTIQRDFVWKDQNIKRFIQAISKGYPLGMVVLWKPGHKHIVDTIPFMDIPNPLPSNYCVLDGQQRITTMLLIKNGFRILREKRVIERKHLYFDPFENDFYLRYQPFDENEISLFDVANQSLTYNEFLISLSKRKKEKAVKRMQNLAKSLRENQVGVRIVGPSYGYNEVARIFLAINSEGVKIGTIDMFFSLLASEFSKSFKDNILRFHYRTSRLTRTTLRTPIRLLAAALNLSQGIFTARRMEKAIGEMSSNQRRTKEEWKRVKDALSESYTLLTERGLEDLNILPAEAALTPFAYFIYNSRGRLSNKNLNLLVYWLLMASFHGRYSKSVNTFLDWDLEMIRNHGSIEKLLGSLRKATGLKIKSKDFDRRYSNRHLLLMIAAERNLGALDWFRGRLVTTTEAQIHHIFPRKYLRDNGIRSRDRIDHICNVTMISQPANLDISSRAPIDYFNSSGSNPGVDETKLKNHFIPLDESLWVADKYDEFLKARKSLLFEGIENYLRKLQSM